MRTQTINLYQFSELSDKAKQKAIEWYRSIIDTTYLYDEAHKSVKAFLDLLPRVEEGGKSWLDPSFRDCEDYHLEMSGLRLRTWLMNNIYDDIQKPSYIKTLSGYRPHAMSKFDNSGNSTSFYSSFKRNCECPLTGCMYDMDLLQPIWDFINHWDRSNKCSFRPITFEVLIRECFASLESALKDEENATYEDANCIEAIEANEYEFTENGEIF